MTKNMNKPYVLPVNVEDIPSDLKKGRQHVGWLGVPKGNGKLDKRPVNPRTGELASTTDSATWGTFNEALAGYRAGEYHGVSRVLAEDDDLVGFDLDRAFSGPAEWVGECRLIVSKLDSYTERSPGGDGLRIFAYGDLPPEGRKKGDFECYDRARHLTLTGQRLERTPAEIRLCQDEINAVYRRVFGEMREASCTPSSTPGSSLDDGDLIVAVMQSRQAEKFARLWGGDRSAYPSPSESDLALVGMLLFWTGGDVSQVDRLFRQSGLMRSKWLRADYRERTFRKALKGRTEFYSPPLRRRRRPKVYATRTEAVRLGV